MKKLTTAIKNIDKHTLITIGLFLIPCIGIILKGIFLQSFIQGQNPYELNLALGCSKSSPFILYYISFTLVVLSFSVLFKGKGRIIYLFAADGLITLLTLIDVMYFRGFLTVPSILIITQTANLDNLGGTLLSLISPLDIVFFIDFILLALYIYFTRASLKASTKRTFKAFLILFIVPLIYISYIPFNINVLKNKDVSNAYLFDGMDPTNTTKYFSALGYHVLDLYTVYRDSKPYTLTDYEETSIKDYFSWKNEDLPDNEYAGISKGKNLIVIQVESLESFLIGKEINGQKITPVLDELITKGIYFPNIYEQVNEGTSSDCDLMLTTSMLPLRRGSTFFRYPNTKYNSLPLILKSTGYETASIHPDKGSFWNYANALKGGIGFENFIDYFAFQPDELIGMGISDRTYFNQVVPKLKDFSTPFYAHTITLTNHGPFDLPSELRQLSLDPELNASELGGYFESVHYTDAQIGSFLDNLDKEGLLDNSLVVITGDHAGVHKYYNNGINALSSKEDWYLDTGNSNVPFIIYDKSLKSGKTIDTIGGQIDIMPTMLYLLGVDSSKYENTALGRNLLNTNRSFAITTNGTIKGTNLTADEEKLISNSLELSDKMIRADYLNK